METWKTIVQSPSYEISLEGNIRRKSLAVSLVKGYPRVHLRGQDYFLHTLVLTAFEGPRPKGYHCHHKNGNKEDNRLENLEWIPRAQHLQIHNRGEKNANAVLTKDQVDAIRYYRLQYKWGWKRIGNLLGINTWTVKSVIDGKSWSWYKSKDLPSL